MVSCDLSLLQVAQVTLPIVEYRLKKILQAAIKFYKNGHGRKMTVGDFNLALSLFREEEVYGLPSLAAPSPLSSSGASSFHDPDSNNLTTRALATSLPGGPLSSTGHQLLIGGRARDVDIFRPVRIPDIAKTASAELKYPLLPELSVHWLVIDGQQPLIPENPQVVIVDSIDELPQELSKELSHFYARVISILLSEDQSALPVVYSALGSDPGLQILLPHLSRFIYQQVKARTSVRLLMALMRSLRALVLNAHLQVQFHIQQLLPAVFTCIVASKRSPGALDDHWALRLYSAELVSVICLKYCHVFPDLHTRVSRTYLDAINSDKSLGAVYGGLAGLYFLGFSSIKTFIIPNMQSISAKVTQLSTQAQRKAASREARIEGGMDVAASSSSGGKKAAPASFVSESDAAVNSCKGILLRAIGLYISESLAMGAPFQQHAEGKAAPAAAASGGSRASKKSKLAPPAARAPLAKLREETELFDLEEALVPYFTAGARGAYSCSSMFI